MSGGSYDYLYCKINEAAGQVERYGRGRKNEALRTAFAKHLSLIAEAMHRIEWVDSCDNSPGDEDAAIRACLAPGAELDAAREALERAIGLAAEALVNAGAQ